MVKKIVTISIVAASPSGLTGSQTEMASVMVAVAIETEKRDEFCPFLVKSVDYFFALFGEENNPCGKRGDGI